jgi:hypothetical protein
MAWAVAMHNHVNSRNGKKIYSVKDAIKAILENDDKCLTSNYNNQDNNKDNNQDDYQQNYNNSKVDKFSNKEHFQNDNNTQIIILSISICINILLILFLFIKNK